MSTVLVAHPSPDLYGSDRMLLESVDGLLEAGCRVVVTLPGRGPLMAELEARDVEVAVLPVPVLRKAVLSPSGMPRFVLDTVRALPGMIALLRRVRPQAVLVNTVTIPVWSAVARSSGRPVLVHVHEAEQALPRAVRVVLALPLLAASLVVVNSHATEELAVAAMPVLRRRLRLVYNGVRGPQADPSPLAAPGPPTRLVVVGRLSGRKGCDVAVDAVRLLRDAGQDVRLDFVGAVFDGYEWYERELRARVERLGLTGSVRFRGFVSPVWDAYADADVVLVPSFGESFGNVAVEGQLAGRPVVVSGVQGLVEIVEDGKTGLVVPPDDPAALAAAVRSLLADWPRARELAAAGREDARRRFDPARYRAELADLVASLSR